MSRSGYVDDYDDAGALNLYRGTVARAIRGQRGQAFLREMAAALDAMPVKELITEEIVDEGGRACAIGSVALSRKLNVSNIDESEPDQVAQAFGIARAMAAEIAYENDECGDRFVDGKRRDETPAERWQRMRKWVDEHLLKVTT